MSLVNVKTDNNCADERSAEYVSSDSSHSGSSQFDTVHNRRVRSILIAAPKSGSGKTLVTCALLGALKRRGINVCSFKCGPDYIDPMFHRTVLNIASENLDTWFSGREGTLNVFREAAAPYDMAVIEGVMGIFDGVGGIEVEGSSYDVAAAVDAPVILVVDVHGMGRSVIPFIKGFLDADTDGLIKGIILNRISKDFYCRISGLIEEELEKGGYKARLAGYYPVRKDLQVESRHLGLLLPEETAGIRKQLELAAGQAENSIDIERLLEIASGVGPEIASEAVSASGDCGRREADTTGSDGRSISDEPPVLAVARDKAFCFYYEANLRLLQELGVRLVFFSPLYDTLLPEQASGLLLGGGYPELYCRELSSNTSMTESIRNAIRGGMPSLAECGGFMYLHRFIRDKDGQAWPMCGIIDAGCYFAGRLVRFGYVELEENSPFFLPCDGKIRGHEFHYYESEYNGDSCIATKPSGAARLPGGKSWSCIHEAEEHFWGFTHLYYPSNPEFAKHFVRKMREYRDLHFTK